MKNGRMKTLAELRKIAEAATNEGWIYQIEHFSQMGYERSYWQAIGPRRYQTTRHGEDLDQAIADAKFSETFSPTTVLSLIARLEAAEDALSRVNAACGEFDIWFKKQYPNEGLRNHIDGGGEYYNFARNMNTAFLAGQKSKAATLKLPEKKNNKLKGCDCNGCHYMQGWDAALDEVVRINEGEIEMTQAEKKIDKLTESQIEHILHVLHNEIQFYNVNGEYDNDNVLKYIETALRAKWDDPLL